MFADTGHSIPHFQYYRQMTAPANRTRRTLFLAAKLSLAAVILGYLMVRIQREAGFARLIDEPKRWDLLTAGLACTLTGILLSFVRWHVLVAALRLPFRLQDSLRLGALGFALNFVSLGSLGGDLFKAVFLAKDAPGQRTEAVATVVADRVMGLMVMLAMATAASLLVDWQHAPVAVRVLVHTIRLATVAGIVGFGLVLLVPAITGGWITQLCVAIPLVGATAGQLVGAVRAYRDAKRHLLAAVGLSVIVDALFILSFYMVSRGLPVHAPSLVQHFVIVPVASLAGAIPATPSGLGTMEAAIDALYQSVPSEVAVPPGDGTLVALAQRVSMILVAVVCLAFYLLQRSDLREVIHDVEEAAEAF